MVCLHVPLKQYIFRTEAQMFHKIACLFIILLFLAGGFLFHSGCRPLPVIEPEKKDGKTYGEISGSAFPYKWYDYYEGALSFAEGGYWDKAETYLKEAIRQRGEDQWDARTYGRHFVDYFPNRELGITLYFQGKFMEAKNGLEKSIKDAPSAKALLYLERAYYALLEEQPDAITVTSPIIKPEMSSYQKINDNDYAFRTNADPIVLSAIVNDEKYIKSISVENEPVFLLNSKRDLDRQKNINTIHFDKQLYLPSGQHKIKVEAKNIMGEKSVKIEEITFNIDRSGPKINVNEHGITPSYKRKFAISANAAKPSVSL